MSIFHFAWGIVAAVAIAILIAAIFQFTPKARLRRRLKKTHARIASKSRRPSVKFSVKTEKNRR
ncbi:MAG TPA: hypothetical protein VFM25_07540 [Verrucomicrobiae bacterium]|jgi:hypothetical protein|nr:hypothetical protein [Verrucomicrobiae bacterium]